MKTMDDMGIEPLRRVLRGTSVGLGLVSSKRPVLDGDVLTEDEQWRKLELVADTARKVWSGA